MESKPKLSKRIIWIPAFLAVLLDEAINGRWEERVLENRRQKAIAAKGQWEPGMAYGVSRSPEGDSLIGT